MYRETYEYLLDEIQEQMEEVFETKETLTDSDYKQECDALQSAYRTTVRRFGEEREAGVGFLGEVGEQDIYRRLNLVITLERERLDAENICVEMMLFSLEMLNLGRGVFHSGKKNWKYKTNELWWQYRKEDLGN